MLINLLGFTASTISFVMWLPQARQTWKNRNDPKAMEGVSAGTQWLVVLNASIWGLYAVLTQAWWSGAPGLVNLPLALATLYLVYRARRAGQPISPTSDGIEPSCACQSRAQVALAS